MRDTFFPSINQPQPHRHPDCSDYFLFSLSLPPLICSRTFSCLICLIRFFRLHLQPIYSSPLLYLIDFFSARSAAKWSLLGKRSEMVVLFILTTLSAWSLSSSKVDCQVKVILPPSPFWSNEHYFFLPTSSFLFPLSPGWIRLVVFFRSFSLFLLLIWI